MARKKPSMRTIDAVIRIPAGTHLDQSRLTPGAFRGSARVPGSKISANAEIFLKRPERSAGKTVRALLGGSHAPSLSSFVPLALVAVEVAANVASTRAARNESQRLPSDETTSGAAPAGWYELSEGDPTLCYWDGRAWTDEFATRAGQAPPIPADWYPDPEDSGRWRYWDGSSWTDHVSQKAEARARADWYRDPHDAATLRYWDGKNWTDHTAPAGGKAVHVDSGAIRGGEEPVQMTSAQWRELASAWIAAGALQQQLWSQLATAEISDLDSATLDAQAELSGLTSEEIAARVQKLLPAGPGRVEAASVVYLIGLLSRPQLIGVTKAERESE